MADKRKLHLLIVDDDPVYTRVAAPAIKAIGHSVEVRNSSLGTTQVVMRGNFDLLLLDLEMPALSGDMLAGVLENVLDDGRKTPAIILLSGAPEEELAEKAAAVGALGWISRTTDVTALGEALERLAVRI